MKPLYSSQSSKIKFKSNKLSLYGAVTIILFTKRVKKYQKKTRHRSMVLNEWINT